MIPLMAGRSRSGTVLAMGAATNTAGSSPSPPRPDPGSKPKPPPSRPTTGQPPPTQQEDLMTSPLNYLIARQRHIELACRGEQARLAKEARRTGSAFSPRSSIGRLLATHRLGDARLA